MLLYFTDMKCLRLKIFIKGISILCTNVLSGLSLVGTWNKLSGEVVEAGIVAVSKRQLWIGQL